MNILVSGGFGFIGSYLVDKLLSRGHGVGVMTRSVPACFKGLSEKVELCLADITRPIDQSLKKKYDLFVHLASANDIDSQNPATALADTTLGTRQCLEFCRSRGIGRFVYYSTFQVYGADKGKVDETSPLNSKNDYAITHLFGEEYVKMYHRNHGLDYLILRPVNLYGAFLSRHIDRWSLVPSCFCREAYEKQTITLLTSGRQVKEFVSLEDLCGITALLCERFDAHKNEVFNVAADLRISILEVAQIVQRVYEKLFKRKCDLRVQSDQPAFSGDLTVSTAKIKNLNYVYSAEHTLEQDIEKIFRLLTEV